MMPLRNLLFLFLLLALAPLPGQSSFDYSQLSERLAQYARFNMQQKVDSLLELTDPELFEVIPKAAVRRQLSSLAANEDFRVVVDEFTFDHIGEVVSYRQQSFAPVRCHQHIVFYLLSSDFRSPETKARMVRMLEKKHGAANVRAAAGAHTISVTIEKSLFAIRRSPQATWKFIEYRAENAAILDLLLPPAVRSMVGLED